MFSGGTAEDMFDQVLSGCCVEDEPPAFLFISLWLFKWFSAPAALHANLR